MENKNDEEKFIKLDKKDIQLLKKINKDDKYKALKPVKELNDIIKDLKIYEEKIGEKCSKFINKIAEEGEFKKSKLIDNCKEIKDAIKKKEKEEKKKKGKKPRKGKATKDTAIKPLVEEKKKDKDVNQKLIDAITKALKSDNIEKGIITALYAWAKQICIDKVAVPALKGIKKILDNPYSIPQTLLGWSNGQWIFSTQMYDAINNAVKCAAAVLTSYGAALLSKKLKDWWTTVRPSANPRRDGNPPPSPDFGGGDDDDDDKPDDDKPGDKKDDNLFTSGQTSGMDAYRQMLINAKKKSANSLRDLSNSQIDKSINEFYKNLAKQNKESDPPKTDPPKTDPPKTDPPETDPPKTDPPEEQTTYFRTGVNLLSTIGATSLFALYDSFYGQPTPPAAGGENIIIDNSQGQFNVPDEPPQMPEEPNINMEGVRQEASDVPPTVPRDEALGRIDEAPGPGDEGLGRIDEDLEDAMTRERKEIEDAEEIEREDRKKSAEDVDKEEEIKKIEDFMNNMGMSRNAFASLVNPQLSGLSLLQLQNPILISGLVNTGLDLIFGQPAQSEPQRSITASVQEKQDLAELERAENERMRLLTSPIETDEQRIQRERAERNEFDRQQEKIKQEQIKTQQELLEKKAMEYTEQKEKAKKTQEEIDLERELEQINKEEEEVQKEIDRIIREEAQKEIDRMAREEEEETQKEIDRMIRESEKGEKEVREEMQDLLQGFRQAMREDPFFPPPREAAEDALLSLSRASDLTTRRESEYSNEALQVFKNIDTRQNIMRKKADLLRAERDALRESQLTAGARTRQIANERAQKRLEQGEDEAAASLMGAGRPTADFTRFHYAPIGASPPTTLRRRGLLRLHEATMNRLQEQGLLDADTRQQIDQLIQRLAEDEQNYTQTNHLTANARMKYMEIIKRFGLEDKEK